MKYRPQHFRCQCRTPYKQQSGVTIHRRSDRFSGRASNGDTNGSDVFKPKQSNGDGKGMGATRKQTQEQLPDLKQELNLKSESDLFGAQQVQQSDLSSATKDSLRSQVTGGIKTATTSYHLPPPAVAVRNLVEYAKYAHMSTLMSKAQHRRAGYPFGSIVEFAVDGNGYPVFPLSSLAVDTRNLIANPRCAVQVQAPGWTGVSNARVTLFGDVFPVDPRSINDAQDLFRKKHGQLKRGHFAHGQNSRYFVMSKIVDILFVGGFGTVKWISSKDYTQAMPDKILEKFGETMQVLNDQYSSDMVELWPEADDVAFISVDQRGIELRVRKAAEDFIHRIAFKESCYDTQDVCSQLETLIKAEQDRNAIKNA